jgi:hypothetical protein
MSFCWALVVAVGWSEGELQAWERGFKRLGSGRTVRRAWAVDV